MKSRVMQQQLGFSYMEIMLAMLLISVALVPALNSMQTAQMGTGVHEALTIQHYHLTGKIEELLAQPYAQLEAASLFAGSHATPTTYSDAAGADNRRVVYLSSFDADNADGDDNVFTGVDDGLLWLRVEIENSEQSLETLIAR